MAESGIEAVDLHQIITLAGQRNRSAIVYHFGGRAGLVDAIITKHRPAINAERHRLLDEIEATGRPTVRAVVEAMALPLAASLRQPSGRDYLVIVAERATRRGAPNLFASPGGTTDSIARANEMLDQLLTGDAADRHLRIGQAILIGPVLLADIARDINRRHLRVRDLDRRVAAAVDLLVAAVCLPGSRGAGEP